VEEAILRYLGGKTSNSSIVDLSSINRGVEFYNHAVTMREMEVLNNKKLILSVGEKMPIRLAFISNMDIENAYFRIMLRTAEGFSITMATTNEGMCIQKNLLETVFMLIDTSRLAPGRYSLSLVIYEVNEFGNSNNLDGLSDVLFFEVVTVPGFNNNMEWKSQYWGNVYSDQLHIQKNPFEH